MSISTNPLDLAPISVDPFSTPAKQTRQVPIYSAPRESFVAHIRDTTGTEYRVLIRSLPLTTRHSKNTQAVKYAYLLQNQRTSAVPVVAKQLPVTSPRFAKMAQREVDITKKASGLGDQYTRSITYYGNCIHNDSQFLIIELAPNGALSDVMPHLSEQISKIKTDEDPRWAQKLIKQIVFYMSELHRRGIAHNDFCARNLFLADGGVLLGADYGKSCDYLDTERPRFSQEHAGTPEIRCPMLLAGTPPNDLRQSDLFSLGALLFKLLTNKSHLTLFTSGSTKLSASSHSGLNFLLRDLYGMDKELQYAPTRIPRPVHPNPALDRILKRVCMLLDLSPSSRGSLSTLLKEIGSFSNPTPEWHLRCTSKSVVRQLSFSVNDKDLEEIGTPESGVFSFENGSSQLILSQEIDLEAQSSPKTSLPDQPLSQEKQSSKKKCPISCVVL